MNAEPIHRPRALLTWGAILGLAGLGVGGCGHQGDDDGDSDGDDVLSCAHGLLPGDLVITEIMPDPPGADSGREWFEIHNASGSEIDLRGGVLLYSRQDGTNAKIHAVAREWVLPPGGYGVAGALIDDEAVLAVVPYVDYGYAEELGDMGNSDGRLVVSCQEQVIDEVIYSEPTQAASRGFSGDRLPDAAGNDDLSLWCDAISELDSESLGTPGVRNDICIGSGVVSCFDQDAGDVREAVAPAPGDVVISEVMSDPGDDDEGKEWFEVYAAAAFDLNGLAVGKDSDLADAAPLALNDCLPVAADSRLVFAQGDDASQNGGLPRVDALFDFSINQDGGRIVLSYQGMLLDEYPYGTTDTGVAKNLDPDFHTAELNDVPGFSCDAVAAYGDGDLGTPGEDNTECEIVPPEGQCFEGGQLRAIVPPEAEGALVITEVMPNPSGTQTLPVADDDGEWFELVANASFDLAGLAVARLDDSESDVVATPGGECTPLGAGDYAVIARSDASDVNGGLPRVDGTFGFSLRNSNEGLKVGLVAETGGYADAITWASSFDGAARSLDPAATDAVANDDEASFCAAIDPYGVGDLGTPGDENPSCGTISSGTCLDGGMERDVVPPQAGDLVITELMPNPSVVGDTDGEWFEILATASVDLNGLELGDDLASPDDTLPPGGDCLAVAAGERVVVARNPDPALNGGLPPEAIGATFSLSNSGGTLSVGLGGQAFDTVTWMGSTDGASWTVDPAAEDPMSNDDLMSWCVATDPYGGGDLGTPGAQGPACGGMAGDGMCLDGGVPRAIVHPAAGDLVITEWMPNPSGTDTEAEWFEVYVGAAVDLNELQLSRYTLASGVFTVTGTLTAADCLSVPAGSYVLFAKNPDPAMNGGLPPIDFEFAFSLNNGDAGIAVGVADVHLDEVLYTTSTDGSATQLDPGALTPAGNDVPGNLCPATDPYGAGGNGTPGAANPAC